MYNLVKDMNLQDSITLIEAAIDQFLNDRTYTRYIFENTINSVLNGEYINFTEFLKKGKYVSDLDIQNLEFKHKEEAKKIREKRNEIFDKLLNSKGGD